LSKVPLILLSLTYGLKPVPFTGSFVQRLVHSLGG
jgi:hypothetical protein